MTTNDDEPHGSDRPPAADPRPHPEQEHPAQEAHGGSMAPGIVDDFGDPVEESPPGAASRQDGRTP